MKKVLLLFISLVCSLTIYSQNLNESLGNLEKICEKLQKAIDKAPKECGVAEIDNYVNGAKASAVGAIASAAQLQDFYKREIGETVDGVTDVTVTKPSLEDWMGLAATIATQTLGMKEVAESAEAAAKALKDAPKMKAVGMAKNVKWSGDIMPVTGEALAEEGKAVNKIIETLKSGNNL